MLPAIVLALGPFVALLGQVGDSVLVNTRCASVAAPVQLDSLTVTVDAAGASAFPIGRVCSFTDATGASASVVTGCPRTIVAWVSTAVLIGLVVVVKRRATPFQYERAFVAPVLIAGVSWVLILLIGLPILFA